MKKWILFLSLSLFLPASFAGIYKWTDEYGWVHFSDSPHGSSKAKKIEVKINSYKGVKIEGMKLSDRQKAKLKALGDKAQKKKNIGWVKLYTAEWCKYCTNAKDYLKKNRIRFTEYDVEKSDKGKRDYKRLKMSGIPVMYVGKQKITGFSKDSYNMMFYEVPGEL